MPGNHATVVAYFRDPITNELFYLTGKESSYPPQINYPAGVMTQPQKEDFVRSLIATDPDTRKHYVARFRGYTVQTTSPSSKRGFPKGGLKSIEGDDTRVAAIREFKEEIGLLVPEEDLHFLGSVSYRDNTTDIYTLTINNDMKATVMAAYEARARMSELFDVAFESRTHINNNKGNYNILSLKVFDYVNERQGLLAGGGKKKRTRKQRRNRKSKAKTRVTG